MAHIVLKNRQEIYGLTPQERETLKEKLTFKNPKWEQARRFTNKIPFYIDTHITYYTERSYRKGEGRAKVLEVPIGCDTQYYLPNTSFTIEDRRSNPTQTPKTPFPPFLLDLRDTQRIASTKYLQCQKRVLPQPSLIQLQTGKGKSILALYLAYTLGKKTLILLHKDDLVVGWKKDIELCFGNKIKVGLIKAGTRRVGEHITLATPQTLSRMSEGQLSEYLTQFGFVIQDECHIVGLNVFNIIDSFTSPFKLGLSATPTRSDGLNHVFDLFFGGKAYEHILIDGGDEDICKVKVKNIISNFKYEPFVYKKQVFNYYDFEHNMPKRFDWWSDLEDDQRPKIMPQNIDEQAVRSPKTKIKVCMEILKYARQGKSVIAFFTQKSHIDQYYSFLCHFYPKSKMQKYYGDSKEHNAVMMKRAEEKEVLITLATYSKAKEGTNIKALEVGFLVSSIPNAKNIEQASGRIRRKTKNKEDVVTFIDVNYPECLYLKNHISRRQAVYKKLDFILPKRKRGFRVGL